MSPIQTLLLNTNYVEPILEQITIAPTDIQKNLLLNYYDENESFPNIGSQNVREMNLYSTEVKDNLEKSLQSQDQIFDPKMFERMLRDVRPGAWDDYVGLIREYSKDS